MSETTFPRDPEYLADKPDLLARLEVENFLGISKPSMQHLIPHLHRLDFRPGSQRFSSPYVSAYAIFSPELLDTNQWLATAHSFASTDEALQTVEDAEATFKLRLENVVNDEGYIKAADLATVLAIGRSTLNRWLTKLPLETKSEMTLTARHRHVGVDVMMFSYASMQEQRLFTWRRRSIWCQLPAT